MPLCEPSHWDRMLYHLFEALPGVCPGAGVRLFWGSLGFLQGYLLRWVTPWLSDSLIAWQERRAFEKRRVEPAVLRTTFEFDANQVGTSLCQRLSGHVPEGRYKVWLTTRCNRTELESITVHLIEDPHGTLTVRPAPAEEGDHAA